jgi:hypothetical protein
MRRTWLAALVGTMVVFGLASAVAFAKSASIRTGTYKAKPSGSQGSITPPKFNVTLKRASCTSATGAGASVSHLCVALPVTPEVECKGPVTTFDHLGSFSTPVVLPASGKITERLAVSAPGLPGSPESTGEATFSVTFTKKGTATGYLEQTLSQTAGPGGVVIPCASGKVPFTAQVG